MTYQFEFRPYRRKFARSLTTNHGTWDTREGIIIRLSDDMEKCGWGEIAPIPWFGSETLEAALHFCHLLKGKITAKRIVSIPFTLPACQFGFESALADLKAAGDINRTQAELGYDIGGLLPHGGDFTSEIAYSGLLPAGKAALQQWETLWNQGYRTFKWKIGVAPIEEELKILHQLVGALPKSVKLRLDANGGLNWDEANAWLQECDRIGKIEFLEQPLPYNQLSAMLNLTTRYCTAIALDESVATIDQMDSCYRLGWRGIFVIKPAIAGYPSRLRQVCQKYNIDAVFSSVFETAIGRQAALKLASELSHPHRAIGFGVNHFFAEDEATWILQL